MADLSCYHCGLPVPAGSDYMVEVGGQSQSMCCPGCQAVATAIVEGGLGSFYRYRSKQQPRPDSDAIEQFTAYDLPAVQEEFCHTITLPDGSLRLRTELLVEGITCAACAWLIEHHLGKLAGLEAVRVNVTTHRCQVEWDNHQLALSTILKALSDIGYRARPASDDALREARKRENNRALQRLGVAGIGMMQAGMFAVGLYAGAFDGIEPQWQALLRWVSLLVATPVVLFSAAPFFMAAWRALRYRHLVMDVPVSLAIGLAYLASVWATISGGGEIYFDSVAMFTFFLLVGRYLEMRVRHRNELRMEGLGQLLPPVAIRVVDGVEESVSVRQLQLGDTIKVASGEVIPCDGDVISGRSSVVEAVLTGEQTPVGKQPGSTVNAGTVNSENPLLIQVTAAGKATRLSAILQLVERAQMEKPKQVAVADRLAGYFVGFVLLVSTGVGLYWWVHQPDHALWVVLSVLVVTCPCALSLATPTALTVATQAFRERGFLISRGHVIDALASADLVVFDKTGTLTTGVMKVVKVVPVIQASEQHMLAITAALESESRHPIAQAFVDCGTGLRATDIENHIGAGVAGIVDGECYAVGSEAFISQYTGLQVSLPQAPEGGQVWLALANKRELLGWILLQDSLRPESGDAIRQLLTSGLDVELLSGDRPEAVEAMAAELGITNWQGGVSPEQKLAHIRSLQANGHRVVMVGDGINDVPVLSGADVSVAMGEAADITRIHADAILVSNQLPTLPGALAFAGKTSRVIKQNLGWALFYNVTALPLAAAGWVPPWAAAIGMSASSLVVVINALRLSRKPKTDR